MRRPWKDQPVEVGRRRKYSTKGRYLEQELFGNSIVNDAENVATEIDAIWRKRQQERIAHQNSRISKPQTSFISAAQGEKGKQYVIPIDDAQGIERFIKADFLTTGRGGFAHLSFFRRQLKGGATLVHGVAGYTLVKEVGYEQNARE